MMGRTGVGVMACVVMTLTAATLLAEPAAPARSRDWLRPTSDHSSTATSTPARPPVGKLAALALLLGLGGFAVYQRRKSAVRALPIGASRIRISGVTKITPKAQLVVATVGGRSMLLGVTDASITHLMWFEPSFDEEEPIASRSESPTNAVPDAAGVDPGSSVEPARALANGSVVASRTPVVARESSRKGQGSRFREILADAMGIGQRPPATKNGAPVDALITGNEDRYVGRPGREAIPVRREQEGGGVSGLVDVEGQAAGLVARLNRTRS